MRDILIQPASNGFIVTVGCRKFVFTSVDSITGAFKEYQKDPVGYEKKMLKDELNKPVTPPGDNRPPYPYSADMTNEQINLLRQQQAAAMRQAGGIGTAIGQAFAGPTLMNY